MIENAALRMALKSMLNDLTYPEARKARGATEAALRQDEWVLEHRNILLRRALWWAKAQGPGVEAALRKALGEDRTMDTPRTTVEDAGGRAELLQALTATGRKHHDDGDDVMAQADEEQETHHDPGEGSTDQARPVPRTTTTGMIQHEERIPPMRTMFNNVETPMQDEGMERLTDAEEAKLTTTLAWMRDQHEYYNEQNNTKRLERAEKLYREGAVTCDTFGIYEVKGRGEEPYRIDKTCPCKDGQRSQSKWCAHLIATVIHRKLHAPLQNEPGLFPAPRTVEARLAAMPAASPQDAPGATQAPQDTPQDVPETSVPPQAPLEAPGSQELVLMPRVILQLPRRSISAIVADLSKPLPDACVPTMPQGSTQVRFLHWNQVRHLLDTYAPGWHGGVVGLEKVGKTWAMTYRLTIPCLEGEISREATGQENEEVKGFGDTTSNAEAMAFKRAAAKFGVGAWLYDNDDGTSQALGAYLKDERTKLLADLGKLVDEHGLERESVITWLRGQTGAGSNALIPLSALRALLTHLSTQAVA